MRDSLQIAGENIDELVRLVPYIRAEGQRNGLTKFSIEPVPIEVVAPFWRALMRTEARLLNEDADQMPRTIVGSVPCSVSSSAAQQWPLHRSSLNSRLISVDSVKHRSQGY